MDLKGVFVLPVDKLTFSFDDSRRTVSANVTFQNFTSDRIGYKLKSSIAKSEMAIVAKPAACGFVEPQSEAAIKVSFNLNTTHLEHLHFVALWAKASEDCQDPKAFWNGISKGNYSLKPLKCVLKNLEFKGTGQEELPDVTEVLEYPPQKPEPLVVKFVDESNLFNLSFGAQVLIVAIMGVILGQIFFP